MRNNLQRSEESFTAVAQELPEGTVTVLFTDVEGPADLTTRRGERVGTETVTIVELPGRVV
jgi:class 3 adenylate cyclase